MERGEEARAIVGSPPVVLGARTASFGSPLQPFGTFDGAGGRKALNCIPIVIHPTKKARRAMRPAWEFGIEKDSLEEEKTDGGGLIRAF